MYIGKGEFIVSKSQKPARIDTTRLAIKLYIGMYSYHMAQILTGENIDEFDEFPAICQYCKQQKLSGRKVSWFDRIFESNEKTFGNFASIIISAGRRLSISRENFRDFSKSTKTTKVFFH